MKKIITICAALFITASVFAQAPEKMSYQAVVRDASDNLITNTQIGMQISILQGSASGTAVYVETQGANHQHQRIGKFRNRCRNSCKWRFCNY